MRLLILDRRKSCCVLHSVGHGGQEDMEACGIAPFRKTLSVVTVICVPLPPSNPLALGSVQWVFTLVLNQFQTWFWMIYIYICLQKFELFLVPGMLITDIFILDRNHVKVSLLITYSIRYNCFPFHFLMLMLWLK